jgi:hypothetical protein
MPARTPRASAAVEAARRRRVGRAAQQAVEIEWFIKEVSDKVSMAMRQRVRIATELLKSRVVKNISTPVVKGTGPRGGKVVTDRSKPGEFPHAETVELLKTIFGVVTETIKGVWDGFVGTPLDYGLILETKMHRSFLVRTLNEERDKIKRILTGPIK